MNAFYVKFQQSYIYSIYGIAGIVHRYTYTHLCSFLKQPSNRCNKTCDSREFLSDCGRLCTNLCTLTLVWPLKPKQDPNFHLQKFHPPSARRGWFCVASELSRVYHSSGGLPRSPLTPAPLPGPRRNAPGLVIAFVGSIEFYGWLKLPNLTVRWTLNGAQRGAALQTAAAAKFLQWRPAITPTQTPIQAAGEVGGGRRGGRRGGSGVVVSVV